MAMPISANLMAEQTAANGGAKLPPLPATWPGRGGVDVASHARRGRPIGIVRFCLSWLGLPQKAAVQELSELTPLASVTSTVSVIRCRDRRAPRALAHGHQSREMTT